YSGTFRMEVRQADACAALPHDLMQRLVDAGHCPVTKKGELRPNGLPGLFREWAPTAWDKILKDTPTEDDALTVVDDARGEFKELVRRVMLSEFNLVVGSKHGQNTEEDHREQRSVVGWCREFARDGRWRQVRSKKLWSRERVLPSTGRFAGEV